MPGLIGRKIGMTRIFDEEGVQIPVTVIEAGPCVVTQVKTEESDGYRALQLAFGAKKEKNTTKALMGHFKAASTDPKRRLTEIRDYAGMDEVGLGDEIGVGDVFAEGDKIHVIGTSKGKGFQGVVKRHNFSGVNDATHGQHNRQRSPGSIGQASDPSRVFKGSKL